MPNKVKISDLPVLPENVSTDNVKVLGVEIGGNNYQVPLSRLLKSSGGTITGGLKIHGKLRLQNGDSFSGNSLNFGDGEYVRLKEIEDDELEIKASIIHIETDGGIDQINVNGEPIKEALGITNSGGNGEYEALKPSIIMLNQYDLGADEGGMPEPMIRTKAFIGKEFILWRFNRQRGFVKSVLQQDTSRLIKGPRMERLMNGKKPVIFYADDNGMLLLKEKYGDFSKYQSLGNFIFYNDLIYTDDYLQWKGQSKCKILNVNGMKILSKHHRSKLFAISPADRKGGLAYFRYYFTMSKGNHGGFINFYQNNPVDIKYITMKGTTAMDFRQ